MTVWTSLVSALMTLVQSQPTVQQDAGFSFGDFDGDGLVDAYVVRPLGTDALFRNLGDGGFEDVTSIAGLVGIAGTRAALWQDFDGDGFLDLYVSSSRGPSRLLQNAGAGSFVDVTAYAGLAADATGERFAQWLDYDADGKPDLHVAALQGDRLFHNAGSGRFESVELGGFDGVPAPVSARSEPAVEGAVEPGGEAGPAGNRERAPRTGPPSLPPQGGRSSPVQPSTPLLTMPIAPVPPATPVQFCPVGIDDQATANCINASSTPVLGQLYPLSTNLNVSGSGNVGVGTTTPSAKLEVAGTARVTNTLTLAPSGDTALDVSTGSIYKGGALFIHTKGGIDNTAVGSGALNSVTDGYYNTASGAGALRSNTTGNKNTASGFHALRNNTTGYSNTASGAYALKYNTIGIQNTATGQGALFKNTEGFQNTASGYWALLINETGMRNTASGAYALRVNDTGSRNTASGALALTLNTSGYLNTASGTGALLFNSTGNRNTASGAYALRNNTTASGNTASGSEALRNNTTGSANTAHGRSALFTNTTGIRNTATGDHALYAAYSSENTAHGASALRDNMSGNSNTAHGALALRSNTTGSFNTAVGRSALYSNIAGTYNTATGTNALGYNRANNNSAHGAQALQFNDTGPNNTASGFNALRNNTSGARNIALGKDAGLNLTTGNDNIAIGHPGVAAENGTIRIGSSAQTRAFIGGIRGVTTGNANAIPVLIDSAGQLGTVSSSERFKKDIADMGDRTAKLLELRPVVFRYRQQQEMPDGEVPLEYGLIAEEVAEVFPDLVVNDEEGQPFTVKYHLLSAMLLNELKQQTRELEDLRSRVDAIEARAPDTVLPNAAPARER